MPRWIYKFTLRIRSMFQRSRMEKELNEELGFHLDKLTEENAAKGMPAEAARYAAMRELGMVEQIKEECRDMRRTNLVEDFIRDVRYGFRILAKNRGFAAGAIITLAMGIGANTAVFSLMDTILLQPLPYKNPGELYVVSETVPNMGGSAEIGMAAGEYLDYRDHNRSFSQTAAYEMTGFNLTGEGTPLRVNAAAVTASAFPLLGVPPVLGRTFTSDEEKPGSAPVAVISCVLWRNHYSADPNILGKRIKLDEISYEVVGVMPEAFRFPLDSAPLTERPDLWVPDIFTADRLQDRLREFGVGFIGRLRKEASEQQAQSDISNVATGFMQQYQYSDTVRVVPHLHRFAAYAVEKARPLVFQLMAAVACVLLIACANVANLLLARASHRNFEMAIRSAIGAARRRILRQCLVESLLLSLCGAGAGFVLAILMINGVQKFGPADVPRLQEVAINPSALLFTAGLSLLTTLLFGFMPAWRLSRVPPQDCLKESSRAGNNRTTNRLQSLVAVSEIAAALVLCLSGSLLLRSFVQVVNGPLGLRPDGIFITRTLFDEARYPDPVKRTAAQKELIDRLSSLQGVRSVAAASHLPLSDTRQIGFRLEHAAPDDQHWAENSIVSPGYFHTMGIPIVRGREFADQDRGDTPLAAVISETMARRYFPGQDPLGQRFFWGGQALFTIVGIVGDVRISALDADPPAMIYYSMFQAKSGASQRTALIFRMDAAEPNIQGLFSRVQKHIWSLDRDLPIYSFTTLDALISESVAQRRFVTLLMLSFALIALALALIGLFGVISFLVVQHRRELAIRVALGADPADVCWMVVKQGALLAIAGSAIGLALFPVCVQLIRSTLYQTSAHDPVTLLLVPVLLMGSALLASYIPGRQATKVDPMIILRYE
jgi:predicted permease